MVNRKHALLDAAAQLFQTNGISATTIEDITKASGIAKGAFYKHFDSKESLILELLQHFYDDILQKATPRSNDENPEPLTTLQQTLTVELEVATDYHNFLQAVAMDYPPHSEGAVPATLDKLQHQLHAWHERILIEAFGTRIQPYLQDLVVSLEGTLNGYLMRIVWEDASVPFDRIAVFITQCLQAIVTDDTNLTPALSADWHNDLSETTPLDTMVDELTAIRATRQRDNQHTPEHDTDLETLDFLIEELHEDPPRVFLVEALLTQLNTREYLTDYLTSTLASWNSWKGSST